MSGLARNSFERLINELSAGSETAAEQIVAKYGPSILRTIRRMLRKELRHQYDSADFAQDVWKSFFDSQITAKIRTPEQLVSLLVAMARNKVIDIGRREAAAKHSPKRDNELRNTPRDDTKEIKSEPAPAKESTPSQYAIANETLRNLRDRQPEKLKQIVALRLDGMTHREIADQLAVSDKTIQRNLDRLKQGIEDAAKQT